MSEAGHAQLSALLIQLEATLAHFNELLAQEEEILVHSRIDLLPPLTADKLATSNQLDQQFQAFRAFAQFSGMPLSPAHVLDEALMRFDAGLGEQWHRIRDLSLVAKARNTSNGQLIDSRKHLNDRLFNELSQLRETPQLYGEDGRVRSTIGGQPFDKA
ncbi:flagella synthesis protein FlgN [Chitiniphilus eburneus]|uniref:Flagellar protein FlgN n=1 Tax=Chitiniphilus eburneus TaxID=2571148 RepID=A0A4U0PNG1_9NEIS|nr:flagellar protein FlgN [Chitiniphilus eburneus]TJZ69783.1 flagellar protein FlgN [Chitiniphilus eburneus]